MLKNPSTGFIAGLIAAVLIITGLNVGGVRLAPKKEKTRAVVTTEKAATSFVDSWERMRKGTWSVDSTFTRTLDDGRATSFVLHEAQDPPNMIREGSSSTDVRLNGKGYACAVASGENAASTCREVRVAPFDEIVAGEVDKVRRQVVGEGRYYDVADESGECFMLYQRGSQLATDALWGVRAQFCFDRATGTISRSQIWRTGGIDVVKTDAIRSQIRADEIRLPVATTNAS